MVHVYAPGGDDLAQHLKRIEGFNTRADQPTQWVEKVYTGADFLERMLADRAGNVVVISGNNARKTEYIVRSIDAGLNVLADKPMVDHAAGSACGCGRRSRRRASKKRAARTTS